jgi:uncharacterized lipoprotein YmbA
MITTSTLTVSTTRRRVLVASLGFWALAGCGGTESPRVYTLAIERGSPQAGGPASLSVVGAAIPKYLDRPQIVRRGGGYQLDVAEFDRWGEPFGDMVTRVLVGDLAQRLPKTQVFRDESPTATSAAQSLQLDFARFDPDPDGTVVLAARWTLRATSTLAEDSVRLTVRPASDSIPDLVAAMSKALGQLADKIAAAAAAAAG